VASLPSEESLDFARKIGLAARLAFGITGSLSGLLPKIRLELSKDSLVLQLPASRKALAAEPVSKRLAALAEAVGKKPQIAFD
jgi:exopolyphosphatase/guanosine-5'-triphosphate,3'-diphosphate pyrophosphatase